MNCTENKQQHKGNSRPNSMRRGSSKGRTHRGITCSGWGQDTRQEAGSQVGSTKADFSNGSEDSGLNIVSLITTFQTQRGRLIGRRSSSQTRWSTRGFKSQTSSITNHTPWKDATIAPRHLEVVSEKPFMGASLKRVTNIPRVCSSVHLVGPINLMLSSSNNPRLNEPLSYFQVISI